MKKIKNIIILGLGLTVLVLFLMKCGNTPITPDPTYIKGKDSTWVIHDTVWQDKPKTDNPWTNSDPVDSSEIDGQVDLNICKMHRTYSDSIADTNQTVYYKVKTTGIMDSIKIDYKLKIPISITTTINNSRIDTLIKPNNFNLYGGLSISGSNTSIDIKPYLSLNYGRKNVFASYGLLSKEIQLGIGIKLFGSKK